jgi:hypothetical protein
MRAWRARDVPYEWVGYYLPAAPCHKGTSWGGKRQRLADMGWGVAVVYVGQQPWGEVSVPAAARAAAVAKPKSAAKKSKPNSSGKSAKTAKTAEAKTSAVKKSAAAKDKTTARSRKSRASAKKPAVKTKRAAAAKARSKAASAPKTCDRKFVTAERGRTEADDAIAKTTAEGFAPGTVVFLNIERMNRVPERMREYYRAWTARMLEVGLYRPGFYAHKYNAQIVYDDVKAIYAAAGRTEEPPFWVAGGRGFSPEREPHEVGHAFAKVWQGVLDVVEEWKGFKLPIDVNVARVPSPSLLPDVPPAD